MIARLAASAALAAGLVLLPAAGAAFASSSSGLPGAGASVSVQPASAALGQTVTVTGEGWPIGVQVQVEVCGDSAANGSSDCDAASAAMPTTDGAGTFQVRLVVSKPPTGCPCVIHTVPVSWSPSSAALGPVDVAFGVPGLASGAPPKTVAAVGRAELLDVEVLDDSTPMTVFGGAAGKLVTVTVGNVGDAPLADPHVEVGTGQGSEVAGWMDVPWGGPLAAGQTRKLTVAVSLRGFGFHSYTIGASLGPQVRTTTVTVRPWGLIVVIVVIPLLVIGLGIAAVYRFRRA